MKDKEYPSFDKYDMVTFVKNIRYLHIRDFPLFQFVVSNLCRCWTDRKQFRMFFKTFDLHIGDFLLLQFVSWMKRKQF